MVMAGRSVNLTTHFSGVVRGMEMVISHQLSGLQSIAQI